MKILHYFFLILIFLSITGCDANVATGIYAGSGWGNPVFGTGIYIFPKIDRSNLTPQDIELINNAKNTARKHGYTIEDFNTPQAISFRAYKHIDNIYKNDIDGLPDFITKDGERFITVKNGNSNDAYKIKAIVDLTNNKIGAMKNIAYSPSDITFRMDLPGKLTYTNAQRIINDGKSIEWKLIPDKKNLIEVSFEVKR